jgi:twitching motility protein PilT
MKVLDRLLKFAVQSGASDLHLTPTHEPTLRLHGTLRKLNAPPSPPTELEELLFEVLTTEQREILAEKKSIDLCYDLPGTGRFRVNIYRQRLGLAGNFRVLPQRVPTLAELGLPPAVERMLSFRQGLVLVTGPAGCGKTTTLAAMINHLNETRQEHIVTVEDPIEVVHDDQLSIVQQREIGIDTSSYAAALRHVIRQDPDVIFIGEIRDSDSALAAIQAAETGHLVISTLHTIDAMETINRVLDLFPPEQQREIRSSFAGALRGIVSQRLVGRADGKGRVPVVEVLVNTGRVFDRIVDPEQTAGILDVISGGEFYGMQTFDQALVKLVKEGVVAADEARRTATNPHDFDLALHGTLERRAAFDDAAAADGLPY